MTRILSSPAEQITRKEIWWLCRTITLIQTSDWHLCHKLAGHPREHEHDAFLT